MSKNTYPLFTVIIPQKNRAEYLEATIRTCMIQDYPNLQIVVSDDCSDDNSVAVANKLADIDSRVKVFAHHNHLGMHDNFEFALNQATEGYVIALGGDDGLTPGCIWKMYNILRESGKQLLTWIPASFYYPEINSNEDDCLLIVRRKRAHYRILKSKDFLQKISSTFRYQIDECPMFYVKGVASVDLVNRVKQRTKDHCFYYCPTPDGYSGVVLAGEVDEYVMSYEPLSIMGTTSKSQGKNYRRNDERSRFESQQFFNDSIRRTMHQDLDSQPYSPIVTLMTADYLLTAKDLPDWPARNAYDVSIRNLLVQTFSFISQSYFSNETLVRELIILRKIAEKHNMIELYDSLYQTTRKKIMHNKVKKEFTITRSLRFSGAEIGVNDIFEASLAIPFIYNFASQFNFKKFCNGVLNGAKALLDTKKYSWESLPELDFNNKK
jgi:glycosyltransferase involved in cell wall biosynthesis